MCRLAKKDTTIFDSDSDNDFDGEMQDDHSGIFYFFIRPVQFHSFTM